MEKYSNYDYRWDPKREHVHISEVIKEIFAGLRIEGETEKHSDE